MLALCIILAVLLLIFILPVGADAAYIGAAVLLKIKIGPFRLQILPKKEKKEKAKKEKKPKAAEGHEQKPKPKLKLTLDDILKLAKLGLKALSRFRKSLSIDVFLLHMVCAAKDPYGAVMQFGCLNAGLGALSPLLHKALKIRSEEIRIAVDMEPGPPVIEARLVATLQIWEILYIGICAGFAFLRWYLRRRKQAKGAARPIEQNG